MNPPSIAHVPICGPFHFHLAHKSNGGYGTIISILIGAKKLHEEKMWGIRIVGTLFSVGEGWEAYKEWTGARDRGEGALTLGTFWRPVQAKARRPKTLQMQASPISTKPFQDDSRFKDCQPEDGPILAIHSISWFSLSSLTTRVDAMRYKAWEDTENKGGSLQTNGWVDEMIVNGREEFISSRHSGIYRSGRNLICWQVHCQIDRKVDMPNIVKLVTCMVVLVWTFVIQTSIQTHCRTLLQVRSIFLPWSNGWITYCADIIWALGGGWLEWDGNMRGIFCISLSSLVSGAADDSFPRVFIHSSPEQGFRAHAWPSGIRNSLPRNSIWDCETFCGRYDWQPSASSSPASYIESVFKYTSENK